MESIIPTGVNLNRLFFEEGDEPIVDDVEIEPAQQPVQAEVIDIEDDDVDMGGLFGDDDEY